MPSLNMGVGVDFDLFRRFVVEYTCPTLPGDTAFVLYNRGSSIDPRVRSAAYLTPSKLSSTFGVVLLISLPAIILLHLTRRRLLPGKSLSVPVVPFRPLSRSSLGSRKAL